MAECLAECLGEGTIGGFVFDSDIGRRRRISLLGPSSSLALDPRLDLLARLGNRGMIQFLHGGSLIAPGSTTQGSSAPQPSAPASGSPPEPSPAENAPAAEAPAANATPVTTPPATTTPAAPQESPPAPQEATPPPRAAGEPVVAPADLRAPALLGLRNPLTNYLSNAADYSFAARGLGALVDQVSNPYLSGGLDLALAYPLFRLRQYLHEGGHYRSSAFYGNDPSIDFPLFGRPSTSRGGPLSESELAVVSGAGMTQGQLNKMLLYSDWARNGVARPLEAMAYLLAGSDIWTYTLARGLLGTPQALDDPFTYTNQLKTLGHPLSMGSLFGLSLAGQALSGGTVSSLYGLYRMVRYGDRRIEMLSPKVGGLQFTLPDFNVLLGDQGPIVGAQTLLSPRSSIPIEAHLDVQPLSLGLAGGAKAFDVPLPWVGSVPGLRSVRLNPFFDVSATSKDPGYRFGTDVVIPVGPLVLSGTAAYSSEHYLLNEVTSSKGFQLSGGIGLRYW